MTDTSMYSSSLAEEEPHASNLMAVRFPECKACRVQYEFPTLNGPQVQTDKATIIVAQLEKEGKLGDLQNLRFRVSEISVNTQNGIISVKHKGRLSLQKGQEWIQYMREQLDPVIGTVNVEIETAPHSEAIQADVNRTFSNAVASCFLSLDRKSLLIVSSKEQDVKQVEAFVRAWSGTVAVCQDVDLGDCRVSSDTVSRVASRTRQDINYELVDTGSKDNLASTKPDQVSLQVPQTSGACGEVSQTPVFSHSDSAFFRSFYNTLSLQSMEFRTFSCKLFKITDKLTVQFYKKDIVKSKTDAVVSPTNSRLETIGEVAKALSQAAGPEMDQELCYELIQHNGKIRTTQVVKTGAYGQLGHLKCVLHTVGPHTSNETAEFELTETFLNCLLFADNLVLKSITFPFISTGGYCVTLDQCVTRFLTSVLVYSRNKYSSLEEIHIVHYDINIVSEAILIAEQFLKTETCMTATQWIVHERQQYNNRHITQTDGVKNVKAKHSKSRPKDKMPALPKKKYVNTGASLQKANSQTQSQSVMESSIITAKMSGDSADTSALHLTTSPEDTDRACPICTLPVQNPKTLTCGCVFCTVCINNALRKASVCPQCQLDFNIQLGNQPRLGQMFQRISHVTHVAGFPTPGAIIINFKFPDGVQEAYHPEPGKQYKGIYRTAYLPLSQEGQEVLVLLEKAFRHFLMFTITDVPTAGQTSPIVWNGIHLITNTKAENFPDQALDYLQRVKKELARKGIVA